MGKGRKRERLGYLFCGLEGKGKGGRRGGMRENQNFHDGGNGGLIGYQGREKRRSEFFFFHRMR